MKKIIAVVYANGGSTFNCLSVTPSLLFKVVPFSFSSALIGDEDENVKKCKSLIRNFTNGICEMPFESSMKDEEEIGVDWEVGGGGFGVRSVLLASTQGFFKPQLGYLM
jgi:hypothetical protein